jgi:DNA-binding beta-propeller fold protein YncE
VRQRRTTGVTVALIAALGISCVAPSSAGAATTGTLRQRALCFDATNTQCTPAPAVGSPVGVVVSPDGKNLYATDFIGSAVAVFRRSVNGSLSPLAGTAGCVSATGTGGACATGKGLSFALRVTVTADGKNVYVASFQSDAVAVFSRSSTDGALTQLSGTDGCIGAAAGCAGSANLHNAFEVVAAPDGAYVYVAAAERLVVFSRNTTTGALTEHACYAPSSVPGCGTVPSLAGIVDIAVSPDSKNVYTVASTTVGETQQDALTEFSRDPDGLLSVRGCEGAAAGCDPAVGVEGLHAVTVAPNGKSVYASAGLSGNGSVAAFTRATAVGTHGELTQLAGTAGCVSVTTDAGSCRQGHALQPGQLADLTVSSDNRSVYVAAGSADAVAVLLRGTGGALSQPSGAGGCVSDAGGGNCADGKALESAAGVAASRDGNNVYVTGNAGLTVFTRISPPQTTITRGPSGETTDRTPTYRFTSSEANSTFQCKVDDGAWKSCTSPRTLGKQSFGRHVFKVRARDAVGTFDPTPAKRRFKVVRS